MDELGPDLVVLKKNNMESHINLIEKVFEQDAMLKNVNLEGLGKQATANIVVKSDYAKNFPFYLHMVPR